MVFDWTQAGIAAESWLPAERQNVCVSLNVNRLMWKSMAGQCAI